MAQGSTMDAMSLAIDEAAVMLYGVSLAYKESGNCRLEANYAHQQAVDMIPLMLERNYAPRGWLGMILGTRIWFAFFDAETDDELSFEARVDGLAREIGERGKKRSEKSGGPAAMAEEEEGVPPGGAHDATQAPSAAASRVARHGGGFSPSLQMLPPSSPVHPQQLQVETNGGGFSELVSFFQEMQATAKLERGELEVRLAEAMSTRSQPEALDTPLLVALQECFERLHGAELLTEAELFVLEDAIADASDLRQATAPGLVTLEQVNSMPEHFAAIRKLLRMASTVETFGSSDSALARQLRRQFV